MIPANYFVRLRGDAARGALVLPQPEGAGVRQALGLLNGVGATEVQMRAVAGNIDGPQAELRLFYWLARLEKAGQLEYVLRLSDRTDVRLRPQRGGNPFRTARYDPQRPYVVSPFAFTRGNRGCMQLESPLLPAILVFESWLPAAVFAEYRVGTRCDQVVAALPPAVASDVEPLSELLVLAGLLEDPETEVSPSRPLWEFHELLFHQRTSTPRLDERFGAVVPHRQPEPPLQKVESRDGAVGLPEARSVEKGFLEVLESRRSVMTPGSGPLRLPDLATFLYRTAHFQTETHRALPGAGCRQELEFYAVVQNVDGLTPGLYHYGARSHDLLRLGTSAAVCGEMLERASLAWSTGRHLPHVLVVVASRFTRMSSRYASIAYRNTLLDAGIAVEAMYLIATALGLAPCALGINVPELFAQGTGLDPFEEIPLAVFALSSI